MFDLEDDLYRDVLSSLSGPPPNVEAARRELGPRISVAARRRRLVRVSAGVALAVLVPAAALLADGVDRGTKVVVVNDPRQRTTVPLTSTPAPTPTVRPIAPVEPTTTDPAQRSRAPAATPDAPRRPREATGDAVGSATANGRTTPAAPPVPAVSSAPVSPVSTASEATDARPPAMPATRTFASPGGSITVQSDGRSLTLLSVTPASGWAVGEWRIAPDQLEVQFVGPSGDATAWAQLDGGHLTGGSGGTGGAAGPGRTGG